MIPDVGLVSLVFVLISILISMTLHEAMHAFTGYWLGDDTAYLHGRVSLNPIKHIDLYTTVLLPIVLILSGLPPFFAARPVPFNPSRVRYYEYGAALVGIIGPITNLALAFFGAGLLHLLYGALNVWVVSFLTIFVIINVAFFVFNMIPFPPLDGSRLLYAFAPDSVRTIMSRIESFGFMAIVVFMVIFFVALAPLIININQTILNFLL